MSIFVTTKFGYPTGFATLGRLRLRAYGRAASSLPERTRLLWSGSKQLGCPMCPHLVAHPTARKWVITPVINGISKVNPLITGVITHLLSGMSYQAEMMVEPQLKTNSTGGSINRHSDFSSGKMVLQSATWRSGQWVPSNVYKRCGVYPAFYRAFSTGNHGFATSILVYPRFFLDPYEHSEMTFPPKLVNL